ncbi:MAG: RNA helicase [Elusimicrobia bacterium]|nr:MAG: RNA helicase [Elusimicrobiota bacterium]
MAFSGFDLHPDLLKGIDEMGFEKPTPIQKEAVPEALKGRDILGSAQTGSGKTVAFALPALHRILSGNRESGARVLVLTPTRELAAQIEDTFKQCCQFTKLRCLLVIGGESMGRQISEMHSTKGLDVVIATPGRLLDHLRNTRGFDLKGVETVVLDEADRMLDMGFLPDVSRILERLPRNHQTLMFSATIPPEIENLVSRFLKDPLRIEIDPPRKPAEGVIQKIYPVTQVQKYGLLHALLDRAEVRSSLVFTSTKKRADIVAGSLRTKDIPAAVIHSDLSQSKRKESLESFRDQKVEILVATDIAARGLDIRHVSHVFNFDVPLYAEDYLHRIGRTARAFTVGDAITLMGPDERPPMESIERYLKMTIERCALDGFDYDVPPRLSASKKSSASSRFRLPRRSSRRGKKGFF